MVGYDDLLNGAFQAKQIFVQMGILFSLTLSRAESVQTNKHVKSPHTPKDPFMVYLPIHVVFFNGKCR